MNSPWSNKSPPGKDLTEADLKVDRLKSVILASTLSPVYPQSVESLIHPNKNFVSVIHCPYKQDIQVYSHTRGVELYSSTRMHKSCYEWESSTDRSLISLSFLTICLQISIEYLSIGLFGQFPNQSNKCIVRHVCNKSNTPLKKHGGVLVSWFFFFSFLCR